MNLLIQGMTANHLDVPRHQPYEWAAAVRALGLMGLYPLLHGPGGLNLKLAERAPKDSLELRRPGDHSRRLGD